MKEKYHQENDYLDIERIKKYMEIDSQQLEREIAEIEEKERKRLEKVRAARKAK